MFKVTTFILSSYGKIVISKLLLSARFYPGFVFTGNYNYNTGLVNNTGNGYYWSRTVYNANNSYNLNLNSSGVNPQNNNNKGNGFAVRCVSAY